MSGVMCKHLMPNQHLQRWHGTDHTEPVQASSIDPFASAGWTGYPACRLACWAGGDAAELTAAESQRVERLKSDVRRENLRGSLTVRRQLVGEMTGTPPEEVRFSALEDGAPVLDAPAGWCVSLSNKDSITVVALERPPAAIGVDIERVRKLDWRAMLSMTCADAEREQIEGALSVLGDPLPAFFRMWTLKEAALKSTQQGFAADAHRVLTPAEILFAPGTGTMRAFDRTYSYWTANHADFVVSLVRRCD